MTRVRLNYWIKSSGRRHTAPTRHSMGRPVCRMSGGSNPSLIVADDNLPGLTGREMCKRLRQDPSTKHIPIIVMSGFSSEERRAEPWTRRRLHRQSRIPGWNCSLAYALLRRCRQSQAQDEELPEDLALTENLYVAVYRGKNLTLSAHEWKALRRLGEQPSGTLFRAKNSNLCSGETTASCTTENSIDACNSSTEAVARCPIGGVHQNRAGRFSPLDTSPRTTQAGPAVH